MTTTVPPGSGSTDSPTGGPTDIVFGIKVTATGVKDAFAGIDKLTKDAQTGFDNLNRSAKQTAGIFDNLTRSVEKFGQALASSYGKVPSGPGRNSGPAPRGPANLLAGGLRFSNIRHGLFAGRPVAGTGLNAWDPSLDRLSLNNTATGGVGNANFQNALNRNTKATIANTKALHRHGRILLRRGGGGGGGGGGIDDIGSGGGGGGGGPSGSGRASLYRARRGGMDAMQWYALQSAMNLVAGPLRRGMQISRGVSTQAQQLGYGYEEGRYESFRNQWGAGMLGVSAEQGAATASAMMSAHLTSRQKRQYGPLFTAMGQARGISQGTLAGGLRALGGAGITGDKGVLELSNVARMNPFTGEEAVTSLSDFARTAQPFLRKYGSNALRQAGVFGAKITAGIGAEQGGAEASAAMMNLLGRLTNPADAKAQMAGAGIFGASTLEQFRKGDLSGLTKGLARQAKHFEGMSPEARHASLSNYAQALGVDVNVLDSLFANAAKIDAEKPADAFKSMAEAQKEFNDGAEKTIDFFEKMTNLFQGLTSGAGSNTVGKVIGMAPSGVQMGADAMIMYAVGKGLFGKGAAAAGAAAATAPMLGPALGGVKAGLGNKAGYSALGTSGKVARVGRIAGAGVGVAAGLYGMSDAFSLDNKKSNWADKLGTTMLAAGSGIAFANPVIGGAVALGGLLLQGVFGGTGSEASPSAGGDGVVQVSDPGLAKIEAAISTQTVMIARAMGIQDVRGQALSRTGIVRAS